MFQQTNRKFRLKWPWEQDRQMAIYNRSSESIQIASQPNQLFMHKRLGHIDWCLSHLPMSNCFISHHCENVSSKKRLMRIYSQLYRNNINNKNFIDNSNLGSVSGGGIGEDGENLGEKLTEQQITEEL